MATKAGKHLYVYRRTGRRWNKLKVRDWNKSTVFVIATNGAIIELDRIKLHINRVVSDCSGVMYYAPDAKKREAARAREEAEAARRAKWERARRAEEAANAAEDAEAEVYMRAHVKTRQDWYVYTYGVIVTDKDSRAYKRGWIKLKVRNFTRCRLFVFGEDGDIIRLDREELRRDGVAFDDFGSDYYTPEGKAHAEAAMAEKAERDRNFDADKARRAREHEEQMARYRLLLEALRAQRFVQEQEERRADAALGIPHGVSEAEIISAYRRLAKIHHPDAGGDPAVFIRLGEAKDRALKRFRVMA